MCAAKYAGVARVGMWVGGDIFNEGSVQILRCSAGKDREGKERLNIPQGMCVDWQLMAHPVLGIFSARTTTSSQLFSVGACFAFVRD